jgi:uncharacterized protein (UPF0548 family)
VIDESQTYRRYGFCPWHGDKRANRTHFGGEGRFQVEWNRSDDSVWDDIFALSRPHHFLVRLGHAIVRRLQRRFARDSAAAMLEAVSSLIVDQAGEFPENS